MVDIMLKFWELLQRAKIPVFLITLSLFILYQYRLNPGGYYDYMFANKQYVVIVFVLWIISTIVCACEYIPQAFAWIRRKQAENKLQPYKQEKLDYYLSLEQKSILQKMLSANDNACYVSVFPPDHIEDLENAGIVHDTNITYRGNSLSRRYIIDLKVREYLKKHPNVLNVEQQMC